MRVFSALIAAAACLGAPDAALAQERVHDPYEGANRQMFAVHESLDQAVFEPVARGYRAATPGIFRTGVSNFLRNLRAPVTLANDVLQGEGTRAGTTLARFGVNSTIGILGVMDPASDMGLEHHSEDFGQTLAVWGVPSGPYLFIPVMGPTTVRDGAGRVVDLAFNPLTWAAFDGKEATRTTITVTTAVSARESVIEAVEDLRTTSLDPYVSYRSTYGLFRYSAIQNGRRDVQDLPDFESIPDYDFEMDDPGAIVPDAVQEPDTEPDNESVTEPSPELMVGIAADPGEIQEQ